MSSKQLTTFSDFRPREDDPDFISTERYREYLREYCDRFQLHAAIYLRTTVRSISRGDPSGHVVVYQHEGVTECVRWKCDAIAVCSGLHLTPNMPHIPGMERVPVVMHSSDFKTRKQFGVDKTVLVVGCGETGADVAYLAVTAPTRRVVMSHRDGFHMAPQVRDFLALGRERGTELILTYKRNHNPAILPMLGGKSSDQLTIPIDNGRASLFDTAYVHPFLRDHDKALWALYDKYVKYSTWCTTGTTAGIDQWVGVISPKRHHVSKSRFTLCGMSSKSS